jgi:uncharacterized protein YqjF (DUF2071 family)
MEFDPASLLRATAHRPYPLPARPWRLSQRWHDLLFAHWPIPARVLQERLPAGLEVDTFDGSAWLGVIPFWMSGVATRVVGSKTISIPGTTTFPELNLRTYVRSRVSGLHGVYFFSLDCASPLAVLGARTLFHLPYFPARIVRHTESELFEQSTSHLSPQKRRIEMGHPGVMGMSGSPTHDSGGQTLYTSRRQLARRPADYEATYGPIPGSEPLPQSVPGTLQHFLTERYCLFTPAFGRMLVGHIHHLPWPLEPAQAEIRVNTIPAAHGFALPDAPPILHFSRSLDVLLWGLRADAAL